MMQRAFPPPPLGWTPLKKPNNRHEDGSMHDGGRHIVSAIVKGDSLWHNRSLVSVGPGQVQLLNNNESTARPSAICTSWCWRSPWKRDVTGRRRRSSWVSPWCTCRRNTSHHNNTWRQRRGWRSRSGPTPPKIYTTIRHYKPQPNLQPFHIRKINCWKYNNNNNNKLTFQTHN